MVAKGVIAALETRGCDGVGYGVMEIGDNAAKGWRFLEKRVWGFIAGMYCVYPSTEFPTPIDKKRRLMVSSLDLIFLQISSTVLTVMRSALTNMYSPSELIFFRSLATRPLVSSNSPM